MKVISFAFSNPLHKVWRVILHLLCAMGTSLASQHRKAGRYEEAIEEYSKAIELDPNDAIHFRSRGNSKYFLSRYEEAIEDYNRAIELDPNDAIQFRSRGLSKHNLGRYEEAIEDYNKAIELKPNDAIAFNNRGNSKHSLGRYEEAIENYNRAIELDPNFASAFRNRGNSKHSVGKYEEAIEDHNKAIELKANDAIAFRERGNSKHNLGRYEEAIEDFNRAIELDPNYAMSFCMRGSSVRLLGNHEAAIRDLDKALELEPENALFFRSRGDCKQAIGKHEAAIEDYNLAIELNRDDVIAVANRSFSECAQRKLDKPPIDVELVWLVEKLKQLQKEVNQPIDCLLKQVMEQTSDFVNSHPNMQLLPSQLDPTFECDGTSGSFSVCSLGSWIDVGSQGCCCFLPDTYFTVLMEDGEVLTPARRLFQGANVVAANGRTTEVTFPPEQHQVHAVIELQAGDAFLVVSPDHRILVPGNVTVQAQDLHVGSEATGLDSTIQHDSTDFCAQLSVSRETFSISKILQVNEELKDCQTRMSFSVEGL